MRHRLHRLAFPLVLAVLIFLGQASASPTPLAPSTETFHRRQPQGNKPPQTVVTQTVQTIQTNAGPVTQTCTITLTPVTGSKGEPLVQVVRQCTVTPASTTTSTSITSKTTASTSTTSKTTASTSTAATSSLSSVQSTSVTTSASSSTSSLVFSSIPLSSITVSFSSSSVPTPTSSSSGSSSVPTITPSPTPSPTTGATTNASKSTNSGTSAVTVADNASASASTTEAAFQIPGKKISVLPIGLGIFAGISVIALIVVGLVTYERTKYRKIFRQRKLAEQGAGGSYSGLP